MSVRSGYTQGRLAVNSISHVPRQKSGLECKKKEDKFDMETLCKMVAFPQPLDLSFRLRRLLCSLAIPVFYDMIFSRL